VYNQDMILNIVQIILSILLITVIILQAKGTGLGASFGGGTSYHTKRGAEKFLFTATVLLAISFVVVAFFNSLVR
jgi:preprotein translocase subunit SecG